MIIVLLALMVHYSQLQVWCLLSLFDSVIATCVAVKDVDVEVL